MPCIVEKDAGFCSGGDEDDSEEGNPNNSDDSGVKTDLPLKLSLKNKRKCAEPFKIIGKSEEPMMAPLKKRKRFESEIRIDAETSRSSEGSDVHKDAFIKSPDSGTRIDINSEHSGNSPFRPWSLPGSRPFPLSPEEIVSLKPLPSNANSPPSPAQFPMSPLHATLQSQLPGNVTLQCQDEPLALVTKVRNDSNAASTTSVLRQLRDKKRVPNHTITTDHSINYDQCHFPPEMPFTSGTVRLDDDRFPNDEPQPRVPHHPAVRALTIAEINASTEAEWRSGPYTPTPSHPTQQVFSVDAILQPSSYQSTAAESLEINRPSTSSASAESGPSLYKQSKASSTCGNSKDQRNYKNMTRERRIEANARERTRVHTISAAFETLRKAIPAYSHNQKLSKLSVLRIACSYIMTLSRVAGHDYSADQSEPTLEECISMVTRTIQTEGKLRKKKDEL